MNAQALMAKLMEDGTWAEEKAKQAQEDISKLQGYIENITKSTTGFDQLRADLVVNKAAQALDLLQSTTGTHFNRRFIMAIIRTQWGLDQPPPVVYEAIPLANGIAA